MRLLVIDDNKYIAEALQRGLSRHYAVDIARTGQEGITLAENNVYDVILLDLNLPDVGGHDVCGTLRFKGVRTPIIILTGRDVVHEKVVLLDMGADDYITKPFSLDEVRARIRLALRHNSAQPAETRLVCEQLVLDPAARTVQHQDQAIVLRRKEFDLLEYMMRNRGQTLTRPMIMEHIWNMHMNDSLWANVVDVHIKHLRDKIDRPFGSKLIKTIHGVGYKLDA